MWKKIKGNVFLISTFIFAGLFWLQTCNKLEVEKTLEGATIALEMSKQETKILKNEKDQLVSTQRVVEARYKGTLKALTDTVFALNRQQEKRIKEVIAYYRGVTRTEIDSVLVPYVDVVKMRKWQDSIQNACSEVITYYENNALHVPATAKDTTVNYSADLTATKQGIKINSLIVPDSQHIRFVTIKGGLLKRDINGKRHFWLKRSVEVQVLHTNPLIKITSQQSAVYNPKSKPKVLERAILIGIGLFLGSKL